MKIIAISGLGADERVFQYLTLDYEIVPIKWLLPKNKEPIADYTKRLITHYHLDQEENSIILGVSFGGLIAVEMSKQLQPKCTVQISSVETRDDLPWLIKGIGKTKLIEWIPEWMFTPPKTVMHVLFGTSQKELLNAILDDTDVRFTKWALCELMHWTNEIPMKKGIKISGTKDKLLPPKGSDTILIEGGEHFMIVDRAEEISSIINHHISAFKSDIP